MEKMINKPKSRKGLKSILWFLALLLLAGAGYWLYTEKKTTQDSLAILSEVSVEKGEVSSAFDATGVIKSQAGAVITISSRVGGMVTSVKVKTGAFVNKNSVLLTLDSKDISLKIQEAQANLKKVQAEKKRLERIYPLQVEDANRNISVAVGEFDLAVATKNKAVKDSKKLDKIELDKLNQRVLVAESALNTARTVQKRLGTEYNLAIQTIQSSLNQAEAQVALSRNQLSYYTVRSPMKAQVSTVFVRAGEQINIGNPIATIIDPDRLEMWIYVDESDIGSVKKNTAVSFTVDAIQDKVFTGIVAQIYPEPEVRDGVVYYKAIVPITGVDAKKLYPEMTAQVKVIIQTKKDIIRVPNTALKWIDSQRVLYVKSGETFIKVIPELGISGAKYTEVLKGVKVGDIIAKDIKITK